MIDSSKSKQVFTPTFIDDCQETSKCTKCDHEFRAGEGILYHYITTHVEFIFNLLSAGEKTLGFQHDRTPDQFRIKEPEEGEPNTPEYEANPFKAPRCKKCHHNDPDYICVSNDKRGIRLKCVWCGDISVKD